MKMVMICPSECSALENWLKDGPIAAKPFFGKPLVEHWLEHAARAGAREVYVLASDRPQAVRDITGDGSRWGLQVFVVPERTELTLEEARAKYGIDAVVLNHFPAVPEKVLCHNYQELFEAVGARLRSTTAGDRLGLREIRPGVWVGLHTRIAPTAELRAPCWIGDGVWVGNHAVVGPMAVVEDRVFIETGASVSHSAIAPDTFVGTQVEVSCSLASGPRLINWRNGSCVDVTDQFLLSAAGPARPISRLMQWVGRMAAMAVMELTTPLALYAIVKAAVCGESPFRPKEAVRPWQAGPSSQATITYYELASTNRWLRRWPQLWNVARGEFSWVGNRPLSPSRAANLSDDFERCWLNAPVGLVSLTDAEGIPDSFDAQARAHASYYAAVRDWRLDLDILGRVSRLLIFRAVLESKRGFSGAVPPPLPERVSPTS